VSDSPYSASSAEKAGSIAPRASRAAYPGTPRWVKVGAIVTVIVVLVVVLVMVLAGGEHGPMRHIPSGSGEGSTPPLALGLYAAWS
jgi:hypothetical protein